MQSTLLSRAVTRFAPSPSGPLHLGHAYAALVAWQAAKESGGRFLLRIEDIDVTRSDPAHEEKIYQDLAWLGLTWEMPVLRQSERLESYRAALDRLQAEGLVYPCFCTRKEIQREIQEAGRAPHGPLGAIYPGVCRGLSESERAERIAAGASYALRLDAAEAWRRTGPLTWRDLRHGRQSADPRPLGDVVLARKDIATSYHLAVTLDDAAQEITHVTRGEDLLPTTAIHRTLQALLDLPVPVWLHHRLILDEKGQRLAKRDNARALSAYRAEGMGPQDLRNLMDPIESPGVSGEPPRD